MANINQLPYFQIKNTRKTNETARFLLKKITKILRERSPYHYLIFSRNDQRLKYIQTMARKYKYFLRFDIEKYHPSVDHQVLVNILNQIVTSRRGKKILQTEIAQFLAQNNILHKGLSLGNYLSYVLAGVYLLPLDMKIIKLNRPFLRVQDDYLIFCKNKKEPEKILKEIVEPELNNVKLNLQIKKLSSGKLHQNPLEFLGFNYYAGVLTIPEEKKEEFKKKIIKITPLTTKKSEKAIIKLLNNKILGFGHYYKFASAKNVCVELDSFVRMRLRRYIARNKDSKSKQGNLMLTNTTLKVMGLKSLIDIKEKYDRKKRYIPSKKQKNKAKTGKLAGSANRINLEEIAFKYQQKLILNELKQLTGLVKRLERKNPPTEPRYLQQRTVVLALSTSLLLQVIAPVVPVKFGLVTVRVSVVCVMVNVATPAPLPIANK